MTARSENPVQPGNGSIPPLLAGRETELDLADRFPDQLAARRRPSRDLLPHGPRGNGKTSLLLRVAEAARRRHLRVKDFPLSELEDRTALTPQLQEYAGPKSDMNTGNFAGYLLLIQFLSVIVPRSC